MAEGARRPTLFTVPVHRAFADVVAAGILRSHGDAPLALAQGMLLLPNRRAVQAMRDAFIRLAGGAALLPRLVALGEEDLEESAGGALDRIDGEPLPPVVSPMERRMLLAQMVAEERAGASPVEAIRLADSLALLIDQLEVEQRGLADLEAVKKDDLSVHWDDAFALMRSILPRWKAQCEAQGFVDRAVQRNIMLDRTARRWREQGLPVPWLTAAGVSTAAPAVARLLAVIARSPGGTVILPHVDLAMADEQWDALGDAEPCLNDAKPSVRLETHPQFHLKLLLSRMGFARGEVEPWPDTAPLDGPPSRERFASLLLAPAAFTGAWQVDPKLRPKLPGVTAYQCTSSAHEALTIALAMRETLETPERTAALVTPDRNIATRVAGHLARWGIVADDSAGTPLPQTPPGDLLLALCDAAASGFAPVELVALLNHPLVMAGEGRLLWLDRVRELDRLLRGPRPASGFAALDMHIAAARDGSPQQRDAVRDWLRSVGDSLAPLAQRLDPRASATLATVLPALRDAMEALAGPSLWTRASGRALADFIADLQAHAGCFAAPVSATDLAPMLRTMMGDVSVRAPGGDHPRLFIWGLLEARLQRADRMILAGLNEGQWPVAPTPDPWLAPSIRRRLGLPGLDRATGLAAHDFASALGGPEVILVRAQRDGGSPTVASRLLLRIAGLMGDPAALKPAGTDHAAIAAALDETRLARPLGRPAFDPPPERRPRKISVTEVDTLRSDPFSFYARAGLGLNRLDPLDAEPTPPWRGTRVHALLDQWLKQGDGSVETIEAMARALLAEPGISPLLRALWQPRLVAPLRWAAAEIARRERDEGRTPLVEFSEKRGEAELVDGITITGKPDRIDQYATGDYAIVDYKTGSSPKAKQVKAGYALQLGLLGAMAGKGAFGNEAADAVSFEYWRTNRQDKSRTLGWVDNPFSGRADKAVITDPAHFAEQAWALAALAAEAHLIGRDPFIARKIPEYASGSDYHQLMRLEEWLGVEDAPGEGEAA